MYRLASSAILLVIVVWIVGCTPGNPKEPQIAKVSGKVSLDGKAMTDGEIRFSVGGFAPKVLEVKDGTFSGEVYKGKNQVEVYREKDGPPMSTDAKKPTRINTISAKFWGPQSKLSAEVSESGPNELNFEVTTDPTKK